MGVINILESDEKFMKLALSLAEKGRGYVNPNPFGRSSDSKRWQGHR